MFLEVQKKLRCGSLLAERQITEAAVPGSNPAVFYKDPGCVAG